MIFAWISHGNTNDISIRVSAQCCIYSSSSVVFLAAGIPCLPCLAHTKGLCWLFTLKQQLSWTFFPQRIAYCFARVSIPVTKRQGCLFLPFLFPSLLSKSCSSPQIWQHLLGGPTHTERCCSCLFSLGFLLVLERTFSKC